MNQDGGYLLQSTDQILKDLSEAYNQNEDDETPVHHEKHAARLPNLDEQAHSESKNIKNIKKDPIDEKPRKYKKAVQLKPEKTRDEKYQEAKRKLNQTVEFDSMKYRARKFNEKKARRIPENENLADFAYENPQMKTHILNQAFDVPLYERRSPSRKSNEKVIFYTKRTDSEDEYSPENIRKRKKRYMELCKMVDNQGGYSHSPFQSSGYSGSGFSKKSFRKSGKDLGRGRKDPNAYYMVDLSDGDEINSPSRRRAFRGNGPRHLNRSREVINWFYPGQEKKITEFDDELPYQNTEPTKLRSKSVAFVKAGEVSFPVKDYSNLDANATYELPRDGGNTHNSSLMRKRDDRSDYFMNLVNLISIL